jgi:hypothetical protein
MFVCVCVCLYVFVCVCVCLCVLVYVCMSLLRACNVSALYLSPLLSLMSLFVFVASVLSTQFIDAIII